MGLREHMDIYRAVTTWFLFARHGAQLLSPMQRLPSRLANQYAHNFDSLAVHALTGGAFLSPCPCVVITQFLFARHGAQLLSLKQNLPKSVGTPIYPLFRFSGGPRSRRGAFLSPSPRAITTDFHFARHRAQLL